MPDKFGLVFVISKENKYSLNALVGSLESRGLLDKLHVEMVYYRDIKINRLKAFRSLCKDIMFAFSFATPQYFEVLSSVEFLRTHFGDSVFIAGGPHPSGMVDETLNMGFDYVFKGETEITFTRFVEMFITNERELFETEGRVFESGEPVDLNEFRPFSEKLRRFGPIEVTRGCLHACRYCQTSSIFGRKLRHRSVDYVCELVKIMVRYGLSDIRFISPDAFSYGSVDGKMRIEAVHSLLESIRKIVGKNGRIFFGSFPSEVRPEHVTQDTVALIKEFCDNDNLVVGAQSGSQRVLNLIKRGHSVEDVCNAVETVVGAGLKANVDFIFGLPYEEESDVFETIGFIRKLIRMGARVHAHYFMPLPGTPLRRFRAKNFQMYEDFIKKELLPRGHVFGQWERQKKISQIMFELLNRKRDFSRR